MAKIAKKNIFRLTLHPDFQVYNMENSLYNIFRLSNGLKCVHLRNNGNVSYCGVAINAGSRDDDSDKHGLAHFVEHTIFKGTKHRSSWHISNRMERIGGELNAYTSKEETVIYTVAPTGYSERAIELLSDLIGNSKFPHHELEKERIVVIDEINSYLDSPFDSVYDKFEDLIYHNSSMGHNILGTPDSVMNLNGNDCRNFIDKFYTPDNMVVYCVDSSPSSKIERLIEKHMGHFHFSKAESIRETPSIVEQFDKTICNNNHQAHTLMGIRVFGKHDLRRFPLFLLNNYLGGPCMNSRLNQELRDRRGYVYTVDSTIALMSNCGLFQVYFGCDPKHIKKCKQLIRNEIDKLANTLMKPRDLELAKRQYIGQLNVSSDNRESQAMNMGKSLLYYNEIHDINWTTQQIREVTAEQIRTTAELLCPENCSTLTLM